MVTSDTSTVRTAVGVLSIPRSLLNSTTSLFYSQNSHTLQSHAEPASLYPREFYVISRAYRILHDPGPVGTQVTNSTPAKDAATPHDLMKREGAFRFRRWIAQFTTRVFVSRSAPLLSLP